MTARLNKANEIVTGLLSFLPTTALRLSQNLTAGVLLMGMLMIRCPKTGRAAGANELGCRILGNLLKNLRACLNAAPTAMAGCF
jgi:hypothetical protein